MTTAIKLSSQTAKSYFDFRLKQESLLDELKATQLNLLNARLSQNAE